MKNLLPWERVVLVVIMIVSFDVGFMTSGLVDAVMNLVINTLIVFGIFIVGNKIFYKVKNQDKK